MNGNKMNAFLRLTAASAAAVLATGSFAAAPVQGEAELLAKVPAIFARAEAQAKHLDGVMSAKPRLGDWQALPKAKGTQGVVGDKASGDFVFPRSWTRGAYKVETPTGWTTGFFPGELWLIYAYTGKEEWKTAAERWTEKLESARHFTQNHDMGFMFLCSYGLGIKYGGHGEDYAAVIRDASKALATRYNPKLGLIRSWDWPRFMQFPVIIDSMMNLEMMYEYGYEDIARTHADKIMATQFRPDGSAYHVTDWNPKTGLIWARYAWQGACVETAWSRGQGWAVYGFTMMHRLTGEKKYLERAVKSAEWILAAPLPADGIPYWDYGAVGVDDGTAARDASAAAIMSSALVELSEATGNAAYRAKAVAMLSALASGGYLSEEGANGGFLLMHSTGSHPEDTEIDASINYADYYFLEALTRLVKTAER